MVYGARGESKKILAFFGSDIASDKVRGLLRKAFREGFIALALDSSAMAAAHEAEVPCRVIEDYLDSEDLYQAHVQADEWRRSWFEPARREFTHEGFCWPELDTGAMCYFWNNAALALALARSFRSCGVQEFRFFRHFSPRAQIALGKSDTCGVLWEAELPGVARALVTFELLQPGRVFHAARRARGRFSRTPRTPPIESSAREAPLPADGLILVTGTNEALRFSDLLRRLSEEFPGRVGIALPELGRNTPSAALDKASLPVRHGPPFPIESWIPSTLLRLRFAFREDVSRRFLQGYRKARDQSRDRPWHRPLEVLRDHFAHFCLYRWPYLHSHNMKFWSDLWAQCRPRLIIASTVEDSRFRIAVAAGRHLGIPTVGIPHGGVVGAPGHSLKPVTEYLLYSNGIQKTAFERAGFPASHMFPCKGLVAANEYPVECVETFRSEGKLRLLALTDTTDEGTNVTKQVGLRAQYTALKALVEPPADMADHVEVRVKVHPHFHDMPMIAAVGSPLTAKVLPYATDLNAALQQADLVVAVNYYGSALIHAFRACKPVLCLLTVQEKLAASKLNFFDLFTAGAVVARTPIEFWTAIRSFMTDAEFAHALRRRSAEFSRSVLDDSQFPEIDTVLADFVRQ